MTEILGQADKMVEFKAVSKNLLERPSQTTGNFNTYTSYRRDSFHVKLKVKLFLCLTKQAMKTCLA